MDELDRLVIARAFSVLVADAARPGTEEPMNLETAREILAGINFSVCENSGSPLPLCSDWYHKPGTTFAQKGQQPPNTARATSVESIPKIPFCSEKRRWLD